MFENAGEVTQSREITKNKKEDNKDVDDVDVVDSLRVLVFFFSFPFLPVIFSCLRRQRRGVCENNVYFRPLLAINADVDYTSCT